LRFESRFKIGVSIKNEATHRSAAEIGLWMKMKGSPPEEIKDCCRDLSKMGPRIMDKIRGAGGNPPFRIKYPMTPKATIIPTSKTEFFTL
jgi:hypothetical protein